MASGSGTGARLLAGGATGARQILPHGRVVIHASGTEGGRGAVPDLIVEADELARIRSLQEVLLSRHTGRTPDQLRGSWS